MQFGIEDRESAERHGFAVFNGGPHLTVDVPDGNFTISARTSDGKRVTFAFCPYEKDAPASCVDVQVHQGQETIKNGDRELPIQRVICFTPGNSVFRSDSESKRVTLTTFLL